MEILKWSSKNTPIPPFAFWSFTVGKDKTIGGYVFSGKVHGYEAGQIALKMLKHNNKSIILPKTSQQGHFLYSTSQLKNGI